MVLSRAIFWYEYRILNESQAALGEDCGVKETLYHAYKGFNTLFNIGGKSRESALLWGRATTYLKPVVGILKFLFLTPISNIRKILRKFVKIRKILRMLEKSVQHSTLHQSRRPAASANRFPAPKLVMFHRSIIFVGGELINWWTAIGFQLASYLRKNSPNFCAHNTQSTVQIVR